MSDHEALLEEGIQKIKEGSLESGIEALEKSIQIKPDFDSALGLLGVLYTKLKSFEKAQEIYKKALVYDPKNITALFGFGDLKAKLDQHHEAIPLLQQAISLKPEVAEFHYHLGMAYVTIAMKIKLVLKEFEKAIDKRSDEKEIQKIAFETKERIDLLLGESLPVTIYPGAKSREYFKLAEIEFDKAIELKPDIADAHWALGVTFREMGEGKLAFREYEILKELDLSLAESLYDSFKNEEWFNNFEEEKELLNKIERVDELLKLSPQKFEKVVAEMYSTLGYETSLTPCTGDEGKDIILKKDGKTIIVECKNHNDTIGREVLQKLYGECIKMKANKCICVSTKGFKPTAIHWANSVASIELVDGNEIIDMLKLTRKILL